LVDRDAGRIGDPAGHEVMEANLADLAACQQLCAGMDVVLHLAADPSTTADFYGSLLDNNVKAVYNIFRAAKDQGCRRVIFASSIQVIEGYPLDVQARPDSPIKPMNMYAVCKAFGEATAHYFAYAEGLSSIAVRVGAFEGNRADLPADGRTLSAFVSKRDLSHLLMRCIEVENVQFAILQAVSDNRFKRMDITSTRELVGYQPQDDAFVLAGMGLHDTERWYREFNRGERRHA
ncbi:MAG TPA: NAD(P)-dependent oxidoreductase, partial [Caldilineaceae bacterium]|nr:NAD(P)-dependent oxidoreductase [Caldilineaceae bacterium]